MSVIFWVAIAPLLTCLANGYVVVAGLVAGIALHGKAALLAGGALGVVAVVMANPGYFFALEEIAVWHKGIWVLSAVAAGMIWVAVITIARRYMPGAQT